MFESLTKSDRIRIKIENLLRDLVRIIDPHKEKKIRDEIVRERADFEKIRKEEGEGSRWTALGEPDLVMPCYCNDRNCLG